MRAHDITVMNFCTSGTSEVFVYRQTASGQVWSHTATLTGPEGGLFGYDVAINGEWIFVGAPQNGELMPLYD